MIDDSTFVYLAGPMSGYTDFNFPAFRKAAAWLEESTGCRVHDPSREFGGRQDLPRWVYLRNAVAKVTACSAIAFLPGWADSDGAMLEAAIAQAIDLPAYILVPGSHIVEVDLEIELSANVRQTLTQQQDRELSPSCSSASDRLAYLRREESGA